ncbi:MAG: hypothetical protein P9M14_01340 [Candidatus Alcyoniella australis]|nr:hypothetical protein [Candidatus Alcyoniella australis]
MLTIAVLGLCLTLVAACQAQRSTSQPPLTDQLQIPKLMPRKTVTIEVRGPMEDLAIWVNGVYSGMTTPDLITLSTGDLVYVYSVGSGAHLVRGDEQFVEFSVEQTQDAYNLLVDVGQGPQLIGYRFKRWVGQQTFSELIEALPTLRVVDLGRCVEITNLEPLATRTGLIALGLWQSPIEDLKPIAGLVNLRSLDLRETAVDDLDVLLQLRLLRELFLNHSSVSDLDPLSRISGLRRLDLRDAPVADLGPIAGLGELRVLMLGGTEVEDIEALAGLENLSWLSLAWTRVSDISALAKLQQLELVSFYGTDVPAAQIQDFQRTHPQCEVY